LTDEPSGGRVTTGGVSGLDHAETPAPRRAATGKPGKIVSKNKTRLPRREKKALQKSVGARVNAA
jgi:hypothetical protein